MHHRRGDKMQRARTERKRIAFAHHHAPIFVLRAEKLTDHYKRLRRSDDFRFRVRLHKCGDTRRMIRLHVLRHEIIGRSAAERAGKILQPLGGKMPVRRIHHRDLLVQNHIGIVAHAVRHFILPFE